MEVELLPDVFIIFKQVCGVLCDAIQVQDQGGPARAKKSTSEAQGSGSPHSGSNRLAV